MITKLLDGLEIFLGVVVMFLNSSSFEMPGGWHIVRNMASLSHCFVILVIDDNTIKASINLQKLTN